MGVTGLWQFISDNAEISKLQHLSEARGASLAVDLSSWILHAKKAKTLLSSTRFMLIRTVFYRTLALLKHGVKPVFVLDGHAPQLKIRTLQKRCRSHKRNSSGDRNWNSEEIEEVVELLKSLDLPVIHSPGEAEKMCAYLNATQVVDAVMSDDSDSLLYGAKEIWTTFNCKDETVMRVKMADMEEELGLDRRKLIAFALLSGCDYNDGGVKGIGPDHVQSLFEEMDKHCQDILNRVCSWETSSELQRLCKLEKDLSATKRDCHCTRCAHTGSLPAHQSKGCKLCRSKIDCLPESDRACNCDWHHIQEQITPYSKELKVREKALLNNGFTSQCRKIVEEFTNTDAEQKVMSAVKTAHIQPQIGKICQFLYRSLHMDKAKVVKTMLPVFVQMQLRQQFDWSGFQPISIQKFCRRKFVDCYQMTWSKLAEDKWTGLRTYTIDVEQSLVQEWCPEIVSTFMEKERVRKCSTPKGQRIINDMMKTPRAPKKIPKKKTLHGQSETDDTPVSSMPIVCRNPKRWKRKLNFADDAPLNGSTKEPMSTSSSSPKGCEKSRVKKSRSCYVTETKNSPRTLKSTRNIKICSKPPENSSRSSMISKRLFDEDVDGDNKLTAPTSLLSESSEVESSDVVIVSNSDDEDGPSCSKSGSLSYTGDMLHSKKDDKPVKKRKSTPKNKNAPKKRKGCLITNDSTDSQTSIKSYYVVKKKK